MRNSYVKVKTKHFEPFLFDHVADLFYYEKWVISQTFLLFVVLLMAQVTFCFPEKLSVSVC